MKRLFKVYLAVFLISFSFNVKAQSDAMMAKIAKTACIYIQESPEVLNSELSVSERNMAFGMCMYKSALAHNYTLDITDTNEMEQFGINLGLAMANECPSTVLLIGQISSQDREKLNESTEISGEVISIQDGAVTTIKVKNRKGQMRLLYWTEAFEKDYLYSYNPYELVGQNFNFAFKEKSQYDLKSKSYTNVKVITKIKKIY